MKPVQCSLCSRYSGGLKCGAYTRKIPAEILTGEHDHTEPYKGDNGIRFEAIDDND